MRFYCEKSFVHDRKFVGHFTQIEVYGVLKLIEENIMDMSLIFT